MPKPKFDRSIAIWNINYFTQQVGNPWSEPGMELEAAPISRQYNQYTPSRTRSRKTASRPLAEEPNQDPRAPPEVVEEGVLDTVLIWMVLKMTMNWEWLTASQTQTVKMISQGNRISLGGKRQMIHRWAIICRTRREGCSSMSHRNRSGCTWRWYIRWIYPLDWPTCHLVTTSFLPAYQLIIRKTAVEIRWTGKCSRRIKGNFVLYEYMQGTRR